MPKICDNKSVGILVRNSKGELLLIERKKYNFGFAPPAGHLDGDSWEAAAEKELSEEVGLAPSGLKVRIQMKLLNPCKREGGTHHLWRVYEVAEYDGEVKASEDETKGYIWADGAKLKEFAHRLEEFAKNNHLAFDNLPALVAATNESDDWKANPGLEPPWYLLLKKLQII